MTYIQPARKNIRQPVADKRVHQADVHLAKGLPRRVASSGRKGNVDQATGQEEQTQIFESAAALFAVLATPMRLRVLSAVCSQEKSVNQLLNEIDTTQPNLSQHLAVLYRTGVLAKRKLGTQVFYRVQSEKAVALCRSVCTQIAIELDDDAEMKAGQTLALQPVCTD
jgi:DNA-binding transcriptional ArsR family regulator